MTEYEAYSRLDKCLEWAISWWQLEDSHRPLPKLCPEYVTVHPWRSPNSTHVWPPHKSTKRHAGPKRRATSGGASSIGAQPALAAAADHDVYEEGAESDDMSSGEHEEQDELEHAEVMLENTELLLLASMVDPLQADLLLGEEFQDVVEAPELPATAATPILEAEGGAIGSASEGVDREVVARAPAVRGVQSVADAIVMVAGGKISYYGSKMAFEAICPNRAHHAHGRCVMTRTSNSRLTKNKLRVGGRPLGFLCCWLASSGVASKEEHRSKTLLQFKKADRQAWRDTLKSTAEGRLLLSCESKKVADESSEPDDLIGYA
eukprot:4499515-Amphidinium_carterae.1